MTEWLTQEAPELRELAQRLKQRAPLSLSRLMRAAGMSPQSLNYWTKGRSVPQPESIARVGQSLRLHSQTLQRLGDELLQISAEEQQLRNGRSGRVVGSEGELTLFE